ncbi:MAG: FAD-dependent oxidoreductase, partial [Chloroflexi bacterium]|nr:FAD-dependent oxidoreductase [Chloroflexota bacterium]
MFDVVVIGGGPAGLKATHRAASLGANTALLTKDSLGGMAALDGPVPVRTLAHAARLVREARQLEQYGVDCIYPKVNYKKLLSRVGEVVSEIQDLIKVRSGFDTLGVSIYEKTGIARFVDAHTIETESGLRVEGEKFIICTGGQSRTLAIPG